MDGKMSAVSNAIISIHPCFAEAILAGEKTVELRRRIPAIEAGTNLWIYATLPLGAIVGSATVKEIVEGAPAELWDICKNHVGIDRTDYDSYFAGASQGLALFLKDVIKRRPLRIDQLRAIDRSFHPPRVLRKMNEKQAKVLRTLAIALN